MRSEKSDWKGEEDLLKKELGLLAAAIRVETFGRDFYLRMSECIRDKEGKLILKSLARDEKEHRAWLLRQVDRIFPGKDVETIRPDSRYASVVPQRLFPELPEGACLPPKDEIKAVEMGIEVEKASVSMYEEVAGLTQDLELKLLMQRLAQWEKGHQKILEDNLAYLKRGGSWYGYEPILDG
ncbi:MAG: ferritin family protein [Methanomassiliicoccus sp.]|nr:ferritin family protein [Methanomassiliicoccus sp.]